MPIHNKENSFRSFRLGLFVKDPPPFFFSNLIDDEVTPNNLVDDDATNDLIAEN